MKISLAIRFVSCAAVAHLAGCRSEPISADTDHAGQPVDSEQPADVATVVDTVTATDVGLDSLEDMASNLQDTAFDAPDDSGGLDAFHIGQGCEDVAPTDVCLESCSDRECGYGNCGTDCGACPDGTMCVNWAAACKAVEPGKGCTTEHDQKALIDVRLINAAVYCVRTCDGDGCAASCVAEATGLSDTCSACVAAYGRCADDNCQRCEPVEWYTGCAATACGSSFYFCAGVGFSP